MKRDWKPSSSCPFLLISNNLSHSPEVLYRDTPNIASRLQTSFDTTCLISVSDLRVLMTEWMSGHFSDCILMKGLHHAKYYSHTIHFGNLYQVFTYVKNKEAEFKGEACTVSGILLYAKTDESSSRSCVFHGR